MSSYFVWDASRVIFSVPVPFADMEFPIRWYSTLFAGGLIGAYYIMRHFFVHENKRLEPLEVFPTYIVIATILGARLGHVLFYEPANYLSNPLKILKVWEGGLASHGGFLAVIISVILFSKKFRKDLSFFWLMDRTAIAAMFSAGCIRIGNFFNSEIIGLKTDVPWAVIFKKIDMIPRHPSQLYEAFGFFWISAIFFILYRKLDRKIPEGRFFGLILICGFGYRLLIEHFKENQSAFEQGMALNMGQILSIPFIGFGIYFALLLHHRSSFWKWGLSDGSEITREPSK